MCVFVWYVAFGVEEGGVRCVVFMGVFMGSFM